MSAGTHDAGLSTVLHIGIEKTGTTTIQAFLDGNRQRLGDEQRVAITRSCGIGNNRDLATYAIRDNEFNEDHLVALGIADQASKSMFKRRVEQRLQIELETLKRSTERCILSSEHFQSRLKSPQELSTLRSLLEGSGLPVDAVVVYLRDPATLMHSMYSNSLRAGSVAPPPHTPSQPHLNHICDHRATLQRWAECFEEARIIPRIFDPAEFRGGSLIADFCRVVDIDMKGLSIPPDLNQSLDPVGQKFLRRVNQEWPLLLESKYRSLRAEVVSYVDTHFRGRAGPPSAALVASCEEHFADSNEWVRKTYFPERPRLFERATPAGNDELESGAGQGRDKRLEEAEEWLITRLSGLHRAV